MGGILVGSMWLSSDSSIRRVHGWVSVLAKVGMASESVTLPWIVRMGISFALTQLPVETLRQRQLRLNAISTWSALLRSRDYEQQQVALAALCALLDTGQSAAAFREQAGWYDSLLQALPSLLQEEPLLFSPSPTALADPEIVYDALCLANVVASHPMFLHSPTDAHLWEMILEQAAPVATFEPQAALQWACLAAAVAERNDVAAEMLSNERIKRVLFDFAAPPDGDGVDATHGYDRPGALGSVPTSDLLSRASGSAQWWATAHPDEIEAAYAQLALHRMSHGLSAYMGGDELTEAELDERQQFASQWEELRVAPPELADADGAGRRVLPPTPPVHALGPDDLDKLATSIASTIYCVLGGLAWGALASARAKRPVLRGAARTGVGAAALEVLMRTKVAGMASFAGFRRREPAHGAEDAAVDGMHQARYDTLLGMVIGTSVDVMISSLLVLFVIQPRRAPFAFGGWVVGRGTQESMPVAIELDYYD